MNGLEIEVRQKRFVSVGQAAEHVALKDLRISAGHGEFLCVVGPSGCGKTTLLNIIAGLDGDFEGSLTLPSSPERGEPVIGYAFQSPRLLPWRTVGENIELVLAPDQQGSGLVERMLEATGLSKFQNAYPERLSLGMNRRVALARAFAVQPDLLLMDEPFVSLDEATAWRLRDMLLEVWRQRSTTVVFVSHNLREAIYLGDRIVLLSPAPATLLADIPIDLPRPQRKDPEALERLHAALLRDHPGLSHGP